MTKTRLSLDITDYKQPPEKDWEATTIDCKLQKKMK